MVGEGAGGRKYTEESSKLRKQNKALVLASFFPFLFRKGNNSSLFALPVSTGVNKNKKTLGFLQGDFLFLLNRFFFIYFFDLVTQLCKQCSFLHDSFFFNLPTVGTSANGWTVFFSNHETEVLHSGVL